MTLSWPPDEPVGHDPPPARVPWPRAAADVPGTYVPGSRGRLESPFFRSKFKIPNDPSHFVRRPRLLELLADLSEYPVTAIVAPAGSGKTALAADWLRHVDRPCAWVTLDPADCDPVELWRSVMTVLGPLAPGWPAGARDGPAAEVVVTGLTPSARSRGEVDTAGTSVTLVIDDVHHVDDDERAQRALATLVNDRPAAVRLLLLSRNRLPLPVERLRAAGELADIHFDALRFSPEEARRLLTSLCPALSGDGLDASVDRADGWAAALKLTALSIRSGHSPLALPGSRHVGPDKLIDEYLWQEIFRNERPELIRMLLATAVVGRLDHGLAEAVTGRDDAGELLEEAVDRGLFVTSLDDGGWFQVHSLVRDMLVAKYERRWPTGLRQQHARAARWFESQGDPVTALDHWLAAERADEALRVLSDEALGLVESGQGEVIGRFLPLVPPSSVRTPSAAIRSRGDALTRYAWCALMVDRGRFDDALGAARSMRAQFDAQAAAQPDADVGARWDLLRAAAASLSGDWDGCQALALSTLEALEDPARLGPVGCFGWKLVALAVALGERWHDDGGLEARLGAAAGDDADRYRSIEGARALGLALAGRPLEAMQSVARSRSVTETGELPGLRTEMALAEAVAATEVGDRDRARHLLGELVDRPTHPIPSLQVVATLQLVELCVAAGDLKGALTAFGRAETLGDGLVGPAGPGTAPAAAPMSGSWLRSSLSRVGVIVSLATDNLEEAADWSRRVTDQFWAPWCEAQLHLARGRRREAAEALVLAEPRCVRQEVMGELALARAVSADDRETALTAVASGVQLAARHGLLQSVVADGAELLELVELVAWRVPDAWMERLRHVLVQTWVPVADGSGPVEALTQREREVLRLLPGRLTMREIAAELYVSPNTLKFHLRAIYRKLGAESRGTAVEAARGMRLLPPTASQVPG